MTPARIPLIVLTALSALYALEPDTSGAVPRAATIDTLDKMVVTASRTNRLISETPVSVSVITRKEIESSPAKTIEDLLITQTGVQVSRTVAIGEGIPSNIIMRGIPGSLVSARVLILVDGIPTNASGTPFLIVNEIPLEAIERIEIVRGPCSSLYGANAVGGVINILTRDRSGPPGGTINGETNYPFVVVDQAASKGVSLTDALQKSGTMALWGVSGALGGGTGAFSVSASGGYRTIGNYLLRDSALVQDGLVKTFRKNENYDYREFRFFGKAKLYAIDNCVATLHLRYFNSDLGFGQTKNIVPESLDVSPRGSKFLIGPQVKYTVSDMVSLRALVFYRRVIGEYWGEDVMPADVRVQSVQNYDMNDWQAEAQIFITPDRINRITIGLEFLQNSADFKAAVNPATGLIIPNSAAAHKPIENGAGYIQDELTLFDQINIVPAIRADYHSEFGGAVSPKLGISYKVLDNVQLRASAGGSFRAPSLTELALTIKVSPSLKIVPNPALKPEYFKGCDGGVDILLFKALTIKISPFYNSMKDLISQTVDLNSGFVSHRNISAAWSAGIEYEAQWQALSWLRLSAHGTVQNSQDETYAATLDYIPDNLFGFQAIASHAIAGHTIEGQLGLNYAGQRSYLDFSKAALLSMPDLTLKLQPLIVPLESYTTVDISCKYYFHQQIWVALMVQNVFDISYQEAGGTLAPGRFATIKTGWDF